MDFKQIKKKYGIGLTGGIATGKSFVANILRSLGCSVFDADQIARQAVVPGEVAFDEIIRFFGTSFLTEEGELDRKALGKIIFANAEKRKKLESILHPEIEKRLESLVLKEWNRSCSRLWFYEATLLVETGTYREYREIWLASCSDAIQKKRLMARDSIQEEQAQNMIDQQGAYADKVKAADFIVDTQQSCEDLTIFLQKKIDRFVFN